MRTNEEMLEEIETANQGEGPDPMHTITDPALIDVYKAIVATREADRMLDDAVLTARKSGVTWQAIGDVIGMTRQGAMKRWGSVA
ncbi:hypothetical protein [Trueperella bialowiezensis]|uniref:Uncharacterized protein n=1 Tax=Trueperella bialowiezensis TaxID=312285 RepID=A0A3S4UY32_9ACTO|nr:hypothetical protein [Trueperella bialowiezensis]VEI12725.1 Uncharacterised protein [Trueperella bialowiezensis]